MYYTVLREFKQQNKVSDKRVKKEFITRKNEN